MSATATPSFDPAMVFEPLWKAWPNHRSGKKKPLEIFTRITKSDEPLSALIVASGLEQVRHYGSEWTREKSKYCPHLTTWLNQERWTADTEAPVPERKGAFDFFDRTETR